LIEEIPIIHIIKEGQEAHNLEKFLSEISDKSKKILEEMGEE